MASYKRWFRTWRVSAQLVANNFFLTFVSRKWRIFSRPLCSRSSPRHFQQDLAAAELMRHRVLDILEGVHARYRDHEGAVGY